MGYFGIDVKKFLDDYFSKHDEELMQRMEEVIGENEDPMEISALADWVFRNYISEAFSNAIKRNNEQIYEDVKNMLTAFEEKFQDNDFQVAPEITTKYSSKLKDLNTFSPAKEDPGEDIVKIAPVKPSTQEKSKEPEKVQSIVGSGKLPSLDKFAKPLEISSEPIEETDNSDTFSKPYEMPVKMQSMPPAYVNSGKLNQEKQDSAPPANQNVHTYFDAQDTRQKNNLYKQSNVVMETPKNPFTEVAANRLTNKIPFMPNVSSSNFNKGEPIGGMTSENTMKKFKFAISEEDNEEPTDIMDTGERPSLYEDEDEDEDENENEEEYEEETD